MEPTFDPESSWVPAGAWPPAPPAPEVDMRAGWHGEGGPPYDPRAFPPMAYAPHGSGGMFHGHPGMEAPWLAPPMSGMPRPASLSAAAMPFQPGYGPGPGAHGGGPAPTEPPRYDTLSYGHMPDRWNGMHAVEHSLDGYAGGGRGAVPGSQPYMPMQGHSLYAGGTFHGGMEPAPPGPSYPRAFAPPRGGRPQYPQQYLAPPPHGGRGGGYPPPPSRGGGHESPYEFAPRGYDSRGAPPDRRGGGGYEQHPPRSMDSYPQGRLSVPRGPPPEMMQHERQRHTPSSVVSSSSFRLEAPRSNVSMLDIRAFREQQWQLLRVLLVRRYAAETHNPSNGALMPATIAAAAAYLNVPLKVSELVSRPHKYKDVTGATGGRARRDRGGDDGGGMHGTAALDDVDLTIPSHVIVSEAVFASLEREALSLDALGALHAPSPSPSPPTTETPEAASRSPPAPISAAPVTGSSGEGGATPTVAAPAARPREAERAASNSRGSVAGSDSGHSASSHSSTRSSPHVESEHMPVTMDLLRALAAVAADLVSHRRFKTKLCHSWQFSGTCTRGEGCDYAHGTDELRVQHDTSQGRYRVRICRVWLDSCGQYCPYGSKCSFAHGVHQLMLRTPGDASTVSDRDDAASSSTRASKRTYKQLLCRKWLRAAAEKAVDAALAGNPMVFSGSNTWCPNGDRCVHAHGAAELKLPSLHDQQLYLQMLVRDTMPDSPDEVTDSTRAGVTDPPAQSPARSTSGPYAAATAVSSKRRARGFAVKLTLREQILCLLASTLMIPVLPPALLSRVTALAASSAGADAFMRDPRTCQELVGLPPSLAHALYLAASSPMLNVSLSVRHHVEAHRSLDTARVVAIIGHEAADAAFIMAAVALGVVTVAPQHTRPALPAMDVPRRASVDSGYDSLAGSGVHLPGGERRDSVDTRASEDMSTWSQSHDSRSWGASGAHMYGSVSDGDASSVQSMRTSSAPSMYAAARHTGGWMASAGAPRSSAGSVDVTDVTAGVADGYYRDNDSVYRGSATPAEEAAEMAGMYARAANLRL